MYQSLLGQGQMQLSLIIFKPEVHRPEAHSMQSHSPLLPQKRWLNATGWKKKN
jgi:hypothetical protein